MGKTQKIVGLVLILLALALAGYAWLLSSRMAAEQQAAQPKLQPVVVAKARVPAGSVLTPELLKISMFPSRPEGAYADITSVVGKIAATDIATDEAIQLDHLGGGLRAMLQHIEPDQRAVAVRVDEVVAVGNRLAPGDWVDVFLTLHRNTAEIADTQSRLLLERLQVLAVGSKDVGGAKAGSEGGATVRTGTEAPKTAVLAVRIADIDKLVLAAESGRLILALRPHEQPTIVDATGNAPNSQVAVAAASIQPSMTLKQLVASSKAGAAMTHGQKASRAVAQARRSDTVVVMHGLDERTVRVAATGGARP